MADTRLSDLPTAGDLSNVFLAGFDLTLPAGGRNVKASAASIITLAANQAIASGAGGGIVGRTIVQTGLVTAVGGTSNYLVYAPLSGDTNDVLVSYVAFTCATLNGGKLRYSFWAGNPSSTGSKAIYSSGAYSGYGASVPLNALIPYSSGTNQVWMQVTNLGGTPLVLNLQASVMELPGAGQILAAYNPPAAYTGPKLADVYVSPSDPMFSEPAFAVRALADGGTMHVDTGMYFLPFAMFNTTTLPGGGTFSFSPCFANADNSRGATAIDLGLAGVADHGFTSFSIKGNGAYNTIFNGQGGGGNKWRLLYGKAFLYTEAPGLIQDVGFINAGGVFHTFPVAWDTGGSTNAESALYANGFLSEGTLTILRCSFDNNSQGIFATFANPAGGGQNVNLVIDSCDFGLRSANGADGSGGSHNFYLNCKSVTVQNSHLYGIPVGQLNDWGHPKDGNTAKGRTPALTITGSYIQAGTGRAIDYPEGGVLSVTDTTLAMLDTSYGNYIGYATENTHQGVYNPSFTRVTFNVNRYQQGIWLNSAAPAHIACTSCAANWYPGLAGISSLLLSRDNATADASVVAGIDLTQPSSWTAPTTPTPPGSIAQPGYVPVWP